MQRESSYSRLRRGLNAADANLDIPADEVGEMTLLPSFVNKPRSRDFVMLRTNHITEFTENGSFERVSKL